jgi:lactoylglutathione lyase
LGKARFDYTGIAVRNLDASINLYTEKLGMQLLGRYKIEETNGEIADLQTPEGHQKLELNWHADRKDYKNGDEVDHLAFTVQNVDAAPAELRGQGVQVVLKSFNEGSGRLALIKDLDGIWIELEGPRRS